MPSDVLEVLRHHAAELRQRFAVKELSVFGSIARGEDRPPGDADILVEFAQTTNFDRFMDLKFYLEDLLQMPVDLVTRKALRSELRPTIERQALRVA